MNASITLEACIRACERQLFKAGAEQMLVLHGDALRGWVNVERYDPTMSRCRQHWRSDGAAPFRTAFRALAHDKSEFANISSALQQYGTLKDKVEKFVGVCSDTDFSFDEHYLNRIFREDKPAWPDLIFHSLKFDLDIYKGENFSPSRTPAFDDVHRVFDSRIPIDLAIAQLADLFCFGPWVGVPFKRILQSTETLVSEINAGKASVQPPYADCLEDNVAWRLQIPLWKDGFQGCLYVSLGGPIDQLKGDRNELVASFVKIANVMSSALAKERMRAAIGILVHGAHSDSEAPGSPLRNGAATSMRADHEEMHSISPPSMGNLPKALTHLISPHFVEEVILNGVPLFFGKGRDSVGPQSKGTHEIKGRYQGLDLEVTIRLNERSPMFEADAELLSIEDRIDHFMYVISMMHGMAFKKPQALRLPNGDVSATAETVLSERRDQELTMREYVPCFVALAILEKGTDKQIQVHGNLIAMLHKKLREHYNITRRVSPGSDPDRPLAISQMIPNEETLREIESLIPGIALSRGHGSLIINFQTPSLGVAP